MKALAFTAFFLIPSLSHATEKATVTIDEGGYSSSGVAGRTDIKVQVTKGFGSKKHDFPVAEQIAALKSHIGYLTLVKKHGIDLSKEITAAYAETPLVEALKELLPGVPVKFDGVDEKVTVKSMAINKARLPTIMEHLDEAAGVYFVFSDEGITVRAEPPAIP